MNEVANESVMLSVLIKGGWAMIPLGLCSVIALAVIVERLFWGPKLQKVAPDALFREIKHLLSQGRLAETTGLCRARDCVLSRLTLTAIDNSNRSKAELSDVVADAGNREARSLQKRVGILGTIASVSPLLGLLGTVSGMIAAFSVIKGTGVGNASVLAGGISEALITTAAGLTIAIPSLVFHRAFVAQNRNTVSELESMMQQVVTILSSVRAAHVQEPTEFRKAPQVI